MKFLTALFLSSLLALIILATLNYAVDPSGIRALQHPSITPLCGGGMRTAERRWTIPLTLHYTPSRQLISGTSRTIRGFNEDDLSAYFEGMPVVNAGLPGMTIEEMYWLLSKPISENRVSKAVLGIEFGMFSGRVQPRKNSLTEQEVQWHAIRMLFRPYLSLEAAYASAKTLLGECEPSRDRASGFTPAPAFRTRGKNLPKGFRHISEIKITARYQEPAEDDALYQYRLFQFDQLLSESCAHDLQLDLIVLPLHQRIHNIYAQLKLHEEVAQWKRDITRISTNKKHLGCTLRLVDFSTPNEITRLGFTKETGDPEGNPWYYEPSHFTPAMGQCILQALRGNTTACTQQPFGHELLH